MFTKSSWMVPGVGVLLAESSHALEEGSGLPASALRVPNHLLMATLLPAAAITAYFATALPWVPVVKRVRTDPFFGPAPVSRLLYREKI